MSEPPLTTPSGADALLIAAYEPERSGVDRCEIRVPGLPDSLDGLRLLQVGDLHCGMRGTIGSFADRLPGLVAEIGCDLAVFVGDAMEKPGQEDLGIRGLGAIAEAWQPRFGAIGVYGNHDTGTFRRRAVKELSSIRWLENESAVIDVDLGRGPARLGVIGASDPQDVVSPALDLLEKPPDFTMVAAHVPTAIYPAAALTRALRCGLVLAGHTHGGQARISKHRLLKTSCDLPGRLGTGVLRLGRTLCVITRGAGEALLDLRVNCPPHVLLVTLRAGDESAVGGAELEQVLAW